MSDVQRIHSFHVEICLKFDVKAVHPFNVGANAGRRIHVKQDPAEGHLQQHIID